MRATGQEDAVRAANEAFYAAFEALDPDRMADCWAHDDSVRCVHPGWDAIAGWPQVRRSWMAIFANSSYIQFFLTDVEVHVAGEVAWVTCTENILAGQGGREEVQASKVLATNVFRRYGERWLMVLHHGSPVLAPA